MCLWYAQMCTGMHSIKPTLYFHMHDRSTQAHSPPTCQCVSVYCTDILPEGTGEHHYMCTCFHNVQRLCLFIEHMLLPCTPMFEYFPTRLPHNALYYCIRQLVHMLDCVLACALSEAFPHITTQTCSDTYMHPHMCVHTSVHMFKHTCEIFTCAYVLTHSKGYNMLPLMWLHGYTLV